MSLYRTLASGVFALSLLGSVSPVLAQSVLSKAVRTSETMEPALAFPDQDRTTAEKLAELQKRIGKRPNIVWFLIDDMGWGDPGLYGGGEAVGAATPNMDRLAREGLMLTSTYSQPTCTPTRSAILTGRLPVRTGLTRPILAGDKITKNPWAEEASLPKLLGEVGYATVLCGKWHVGDVEGMRPHDVGFDEFYGFYPASQELSKSLDKRRYPDLVLNPERMQMFHDTGASEALIHGFKGGETTVAQKIESLDDIAEADHTLKEFSVAKIKELAKGGKPFFLEHAFMKVHADNFASREFEGKSASKYPYKDAVVEVDAYIGEMVKALDDAGVLDDTFIFITSDNGPQMDSWPDSGTTPFRGAKGSAWEGGVRVPGIAYWRGMISPGRQSDELFDLMDLFNTSLDLGGALDRIPTDRYIDGIDQTSFLLADGGHSMREKVYIWNEQNFMAMRMYEYKIMTKVVETKSQWLDIDMSTITDVGLAPWVFNLYIDPKEQYPVGHRMNAWLASLAAEMKAHAATFKKYPPKDIGLAQ
ncbi:arylsulfatase [Rhizobium johnstonii]|uniref:Arylsulfatase n=2 Tax=Rhizobium/Agrobacterium group TaxID=227290 RepID=A0A8G2IZD9_RHILV|nr:MULTISPECIES: arylsulfatase [Rhizobium]MBY5320933.1 arylsulfatase [Rhizobium leguminosarum]MBY5342302.1 arylsulfatase [Rhizobium leguminosarum]MBY5372832.1 arylsulfatase [Rhizobium leguminosarum]MBY5380814.1 arylsulfatase [Rhizobium leguminosarum]MBY5387823.1 arylsulfatase [Rhizobium leguminosarum]